ncbi:hypothetical protein TorRG33x02_175150 [Trema orientale]|uniref:Uncharacterized protein n=1 Tax=Trema orientale TaxID=63057 RepID=A0A2P5EMB5_TREOI|nr:hypothetical protein TorRG33x02_175150 [Trema orientale]
MSQMIMLCINGMNVVIRGMKFFLESGLKEAKQVASGGKPSNAGISLQRPADKGKEKALEMTTETQNVAEDSEATQLDFPLTWRLGVAQGENFVIFRYFEPETPAQDAPEQVEDVQGPNQGQGDGPWPAQ